MKRNKISTLSNIMLSPTFTLFAILICSSHIYVKYGEARPHYISPQNTNYIKDFTTDTNNDHSLAVNARYQPQEQQLESLQEGETAAAAAAEEAEIENELRQPSVLNPSSPSPSSLSPKPIIEVTNFAPQYLGLKNSQRYQNTHHLNHQKFNPEQAISLVNSMRQTESTDPILSLHKICPPTKPFQCPSDGILGGECIPIDYLCNGFSDCPKLSNSQISPDENPRLCAAIKRHRSIADDNRRATATQTISTTASSPKIPLETNLLNTLTSVDHRPHFLGKLFVPRLFKRSGISDQRIAEIQMIRALKKQLERASNSSA